ncbi:MAG: SDR family oxidoreductase [Phycisphaerae bacterium]|nr:SDR family oxidoreductase [Phycisphaerae bacterium]
MTKTALVTGGATGLGREVATRLSRRGVAVAVVDLREEGIRETLAMLDGAPGTHLSIPSDLTRAGEPERVVAKCGDKWGRLDLLVNNAAIGLIEPYFESTADLWSKTLAINVTALHMLTVAAGQRMKDMRSGRIVNLTSPAARMALPNYAAYAASKAAVDSVTRTSAIALAPFGVLVNSVAPGMMDTEMQRITECKLAEVENRPNREQFLEERTRRVPLGRRAEVSEMADVVIWLLLDAPAYITAARLNASGGLDKD